MGRPALATRHAMTAAQLKHPARHSVPLTLCLDCGRVTDAAAPPGWVTALAPLLMAPHRYGLCPDCLPADDGLASPQVVVGREAVA